jgi:hypothetical protein
MNAVSRLVRLLKARRPLEQKRLPMRLKRVQKIANLAARSLKESALLP